MDFTAMRNAVAKQFERMQKHPMFRVKVERNDLWDMYLQSFPPGTNNLFRKRGEYDCGCCKQFIRAIGDVVAVIDGKVVSLWDVEVKEEPNYQPVVDALSALVHSREIEEPFLHYEPKAGTEKSFEDITGEGVRRWDHFFVNIKPGFVAKKSTIPTTIGHLRADHDVFLRSLNEITLEAVDTVLDLIAQGSLYRGEEHKPAVLEFKKAKVAFDKLKDNKEKDLFAWTERSFHSAMRIRNTVIGTLLVDLSSDRDMEDAVKEFESKVAPQNYKRPTALVTKAMIQKAKEKLQELGLTSALERRYATMGDISINDILFADRSVKKVLGGDVFDEMLGSETVKSVKAFDKLEEVSIDKFISDILPRVETVEVLLENKHVGNLVSLIAPQDPTSPSLFKWPNRFSWAYNGELADAIKERVKKAGGNVTGDLCCRLAWHNHDDLDLHMIEPKRYEICFRSKQSPHTDGQLDVDMNAGSGKTREPVENIFYGKQRQMLEGDYHLFVHQFAKRESTNVGFECDIDFLGTVYHFSYPKAVRDQEHVTIAKFSYSHKNGIVFDMKASLPNTQASKSVWGLPTQSFHRVNMMLLSPNHWGENAVGNKHYFFMLAGCKNDGTARGFFNEFLKAELNEHRKVFEIVGAKMKASESEEQLSGLGFSSTQKNALVCRVKGSFTRTIRVTF